MVTVVWMIAFSCWWNDDLTQWNDWNEGSNEWSNWMIKMELWKGNNELKLKWNDLLTNYWKTYVESTTDRHNLILIERMVNAFIDIVW